MPACKAILEAAPNAILTLDEDHRIESANPAAEQMFGYARPDLIGRTLSLLLSDAGHVRAGIGAREVLAQRADGTGFPAHLALVPLPANGKRLCAAFFTDLTELKRVERMQNEFVSMVNHELRTPLTSIKSSLGILKTGALGALTGEMGRLVEIGYANCGRLIRIINDLLDMEKVASGTMRFEFQTLDLREFLDRFLAANLILARDSDVGLVLSHGPEAFRIDADPERMNQVLTNLVSNAMKFSPKGANVEITYEKWDGWLRLSVRDCGPGISDAFKARIFSRFAQEDSSNLRKPGGTGLGLSISKAIVEAHSGRIGFDTELGRGTTFFVDLPLAESAESTLIG